MTVTGFLARCGPRKIGPGATSKPLSGGVSRGERLEGSELNSFSPAVSRDLPSSAGWPVFVHDPQPKRA